MDVSRRTLEQLDRPDRNLVEADLTRPIDRQVKPFDAVLALDVIEHLDDDRAAVARLGSLARPGGIVIVSVPALPEMYTEFDGIQGHRRRYLPGNPACGFRRQRPGARTDLLVGPMAVAGLAPPTRESPGSPRRVCLGGLSPLPETSSLAPALDCPDGVPIRTTAGDSGQASNRHVAVRGCAPSG